MGKDRRTGLLGLLCFCAAGCFNYGPYHHPSVYAPPHTAMGPQPYGAGQLPPGAVWVPASPAGSSALSAPEPARRSPPTSFDDDHELDAGTPVPDPADPGKSRPSETTEPFGLNDGADLERIGVKTSQRPRPRPLADESFADSALRAEPELAEPTPEIAADTGASSVRSAEFVTQVHSNTATPASASKSRFGYDAEGYTWLQGVIEFDAKHNVWHLTYSQTPDDHDQFGGEVTLKNTAHFKYLRSGEAVRVEGRFDAEQRDRLGKPVYEVERLIRDVKR